MDLTRTLVAILGLSTASGLNLYLTVLLVGAGQRLGWVLSVAEDLGVIGLLALAYHHPRIALPVLGGILLAIALLLPLLLRALVFVLTGFRGALRSVLGQGGPGEIPDWVDLKALDLSSAGARRALPCFARKVTGLPRFHRAFLVEVEDGWHLVHHRWFRAHSFAFAGTPVRIYPGLLWDRVVFMRRGRAQILLTGRDWRHALPAASARP